MKEKQVCPSSHPVSRYHIFAFRTRRLILYLTVGITKAICFLLQSENADIARDSYFQKLAQSANVGVKPYVGQAGLKDDTKDWGGSKLDQNPHRGKVPEDSAFLKSHFGDANLPPPLPHNSLVDDDDEPGHVFKPVISPSVVPLAMSVDQLDKQDRLPHLQLGKKFTIDPDNMEPNEVKRDVSVYKQSEHAQFNDDGNGQNMLKKPLMEAVDSPLNLLTKDNEPNDEYEEGL